MSNMALSFFTFTGILFLLIIAVFLGRSYGRWRIEHDTAHKLEVINVAEGAIFALLGLLIAFTFTSAYDRFEARKLHIIEEANYVSSAYKKLDLLDATNKTQLQQLFRQYLDSRLAIYSVLADPDEHANAKVIESKQIQDLIWNKAIAAVKLDKDPGTTTVLIPAIASMFDEANTRLAIIKIHPPVAIFVLLIGLAAISAFLAGYSTARKRIHNSIYIFSYVLIMAFTIYVIMDLELPRSGWIRLQDFDEVLRDVRQDLR